MVRIPAYGNPYMVYLHHYEKVTSKVIREKMRTAVAQHKKIDQDIVISRAYITQAHGCKQELDSLITMTSTKEPGERH